jgi:hypothetical protein
MRLSGRQARPANAAAVEMLNQVGSAYPRLEAASVRIDGPVTSPMAKCGIAHERLCYQGNQDLAIHVVHAPTYNENRSGTMTAVTNIQPSLLGSPPRSRF